MSTRPFAASDTTPADRKQFAEDVGYYLSLTPRQLPSQYLYDDLGSAIFEAISELPWYPITRAELTLLHAHADEILGHVEPLASLIELGPGRGRKLAALTSAASFHRDVAVHLIDVSPAALDAATKALDTHPRLVVIPHLAGYEAGLAESWRHASAPGRTLALCLGSNLGNFDPPDAALFLRTVRAGLGAGDCLLLGLDLVKPAPELLRAYDDPLGITAAFNRNLLVRINRELDADFDVSSFRHRARWNAEASRVEMHLVSTRRQTVRVPASNLVVAFGADEIIWTESSYKYDLDQIPSLLESAGLTVTAQWTHDRFALTLAQAV